MRTPTRAHYGLLSALILLVACQSSGGRGGEPNDPPAAESEDLWAATGDADRPRESASASGNDEPETVSGGLGTDYRATHSWKDETRGTKATFIYMSAAGTKTKPRPYPLIYSSDPNNTYFHRENSPKLTVRRLYRSEMEQFLNDLSREGLERLPWEKHGFRDKIGSERAFYLYQDGACRRVVKAMLADAVKEAFTRVEKEIIRLNRTN